MPRDVPGHDPDEAGMDLRDALQRRPEPAFSFHVSPQEESLARAYAIHHDAARAYADAGYPQLVDRRTESQAAYRLLQTKRVQERLDYYHELQKARLDIRDDRLMAEVAAISFSDPADFFDADGKLLGVHQIPRHARAAISSIEVNTTEDLQEDGSTRIKTKARIQLWNKLKAIDTAARIKGMYHDPSKDEPPRVIIDMREPDTQTEATETPLEDIPDFL